MFSILSLLTLGGLILPSHRRKAHGAVKDKNSSVTMVNAGWFAEYGRR